MVDRTSHIDLVVGVQAPADGTRTRTRRLLPAPNARKPEMPAPVEHPLLAEMDDAVLARRAGDGDVWAFATLVRRHEPVIRVYARRILGSTSDVDDVAQDTFLTAWQQLPGLEDTSRVRGWLLTIASRKAIDRVRARKDHDDVDQREDPARAEDGPEYLVESSSRNTAVTATLATMPAEQRRCWVLKELGGYSYDDIAAELQIPVSTVRGLLSRARKNMIQKMEAWR